MSTQFDTGQTTIQYWDEIANGPAQLPLRDASWANAPAAYAARNKALAGALTNPVSISNDVATITAASGNGTDVTVTANNNFVAGQNVDLNGLNNDYTALNGKTFAVLASGLSATQFEVASTVGPIALVITAVSGDGTHVTFTATNTMVGGEAVTFSGLGGQFAALNSGGPYTVTSANGTTFKIASAVGASDPLTITATSGSGTAVTFTAANHLAAGDHVTFAGLAAPYDVFNSGGPYTVATATGSNFTVASAVTGSTTTGTGTGTATSTTGTGTAPGVAATTGTAASSTGKAPSLPSVGIDAADNTKNLFDYSPERYVL